MCRTQCSSPSQRPFLVMERKITMQKFFPDPQTMESLASATSLLITRLRTAQEALGHDHLVSSESMDYSHLALEGALEII